MTNRIPQSALALASGLSVRQIQRLASDGIMPRPEGRSGYSIDGAISALGKLVAHFQKKSEVSDELTELRLRRARAEADLAEMARDKEVEDIEEFMKLVQDWRARVVTRIASLKLPDELTDRILKFCSDIEGEVTDEIYYETENKTQKSRPAKRK